MLVPIKEDNDILPPAAEQLHRVINLRRYTDVGAAYDQLKSVVPSRRSQNDPVYLWKNLTQQDFEKSLWHEFTSDSALLIAESYSFDKHIPNKSLKEYESFLKGARYNNHELILHHRFEQAFCAYYYLLTSDKDPKNYLDFEAHMERVFSGRGNFVSDYFKGDFYTETFLKDKRKASGWHNQLLKNGVTERELVEIIDESAPSEMAYLAILRLLKSPLNRLDFKKCDQIVSIHIDKFQSENAPMLCKGAGIFQEANKYSAKMAALKELFSGTQVRFARRSMSKLPMCIANKNETEYITSITDQKVRMAIIPALQQDSVRSFISVTRGSKLSFSASSVYKPNTTPESLVWVYGPQNQQDINTVFQLSKSEFKAEDLKSVKSNGSTDFFISRKHDVAFFVSMATEGRMEQDNITTFGEYQSPHLTSIDKGNSKGDYCGELGSSQPFHGKSNGNYNTDIYYCIRQNGVYQSPQLLRGKHGSKFQVNSAFAERSPILSNDGQTLYFSSEGFGGVGGFDIYRVSVEKDPISGKFYVISDPENVFDVNSPFDELFYTQITDSLAMVSSNQTGDFDIYEVAGVYKRLSTKKGPVLPLPGPGDPLLTMDGPITLQLECREKSYMDTQIPEGKVQILGRVYDHNGVLVPKATITFRNQNYQIIGESSIDLLHGDSIYEVKVDDKVRNIDIYVWAFSPNGDSTYSFLRKRLDSLCSNLSRRAYGIVDLTTLPLETHAERGTIIAPPFFFDTKEYGDFLNEPGELYSFWQNVSHNLKGTNIKIRVTGYADKRGNHSYNCRLAAKRAQRIMDELINKAGVPSSGVKANNSQNCESVHFPASDIIRYGPSLKSSYPWRSMTKQQQELLSNRRVTIHFDF